MRLLVDAGPGSGKTTVLAQIPRILSNPKFTPNFEATDEQQKIFQTVKEEFPNISSPTSEEFCYTTFIKKLQLGAEEKLPSPSQSRTLSALGRQFLVEKWGRYTHLSGHRVCGVIEAHLGVPMKRLPPRDKQLWWEVVALSDKLRVEMLEPSEESLKYLYDRYPPPKDPHPRALEALLDIWPEYKTFRGALDYGDFCWIGHFYDDVYYPKYRNLAIDESQDLSPQYWSFCRLISQNQILVGDPHQAINGWNGGDIRGFEIQANSSMVLRMKTCFRCPPNIIAKANAAVGPEFPVIAAKTEEVPEQSIFDLAKSLEPFNNTEALIISRYNANLFRACIKLRVKGVPAHLEGNKDFSGVVVKFARMALYNKITSNYLARIRDWIDDLDMPRWAKQTYEDYYECIECLPKFDTFDELKEGVQKLTKKTRGSFPLMSIHQCKGQEAEAVFAVGAMKGYDDSDYSQEPNCEFVGLTRTTNQLFHA